MTMSVHVTVSVTSQASQHERSCVLCKERFCVMSPAANVIAMATRVNWQQTRAPDHQRLSERRTLRLSLT